MCALIVALGNYIVALGNHVNGLNPVEQHRHQRGNDGLRVFLHQMPRVRVVDAPSVRMIRMAMTTPLSTAARPAVSISDGQRP